MGLGSIVLGVFALIFMFGGFVLTFVPFLGTMLSFLAPVLAVTGIVLGGVALSRARETQQSEGLAIGGLVVNIVAFVPAMLVAVTCGLCNTVCTGIALTPSDPNAPPWYLRDSGPSPFDVFFVDAGVPHAAPNAPNAPPPIAPPPPSPATPATPEPPAALPPPPLPPGPATETSPP
ncbi:hypothetical protein [Sandaracinus amylolyticus]|uniref:hypothetical protein n=1 Tax=Sandaracinus amylolyticus TaxID=927083 RepID=UPI001F294EF4|nr:hypothetical protein [Sandaracinus amylolyticus]UJR86915.1 Hypothetical protein I5071_90160 [Sandaracinus amylolyticus]